MQALIMLVVVPFVVLNMFAGIVGGIWLIVRGDWSTMLWGLGLGVSGPVLISLALAPGFIFLVPMQMAAEKGRLVLSTLFGMPSMLWTQGIMLAWCVATYCFIINRDDASLPYMLTGYATAIAPWAYMASKEREGYAGISLFFAQLATLSMVVATFVDDYDLSWERLATWAAPFFVLGVVVQLFIVVATAKEQRAF